MSPACAHIVQKSIHISTSKQGGRIRIKTPEESHLEYLALALQHYGESIRLGHGHVLQVGVITKLCACVGVNQSLGVVSTAVRAYSWATATCCRWVIAASANRHVWQVVITVCSNLGTLALKATLINHTKYTPSRPQAMPRLLTMFFDFGSDLRTARNPSNAEQAAHKQVGAHADCWGGAIAGPLSIH